MSSGTINSFSSMSRSHTRSSMSSKSMSRPISFVESNFNVVISETPMLPEVYIRRREKSCVREISINETPMMLLPKARLRESMDIHESVRHSVGVVPDTPTQGLHLSTIQPVYSMQRRRPSKLSLKSGRRSSASRSEADSGIGSLKRAVTFDNLSRSKSTLFRSDDNDNMSDISNEHLYRFDIKDVSMFRTIDPDADDLPAYLDTFGGEDEQVIANFQFPRPPSRNSNGSINRLNSGYERRKHRHEEGNDVTVCEMCSTVLSERERVEKSFGKVDSFLKWVMSKWGPRRELQYIPRPSYVYRGHTPHFCNFVQQAHLHSKKDTTHSTGIPDFELDDDINCIESYEGRLVGKYRKGSNASVNSSVSGSGNGLVPLPHLDDYYTEPVHDSIPEMKEDLGVSGTEGRPGSPSSLDGDNQNDGGDSHRLPVTGVEVKVTSPVKVEPSVKSSVLPEEKSLAFDDKSLYGSGDKLVIHEEDGTRSLDQEPTRSLDQEPTRSLDQETTSAPTSDSRKKSIDKSTQSSSGDINGAPTRALSNPEPPPSPEPIRLDVNKPKPPDIPAPKERRRSCVNKKTRKPFEDRRTMKEPEELSKEVETQKLEEPVNLPTDIESEKPDSKLEINLPELPSPGDTDKKQRKEKSKTKRHLIETDGEQAKVLDSLELLNDQNRQIRNEIDWSTMDTNGMDDTAKRQPQMKSWIQSRMALSQQSSRFELPMDMKKLETMTPQEYVKKYCIITSRRNNLYQKIFMKNKEKTHTIVYKDLDKTLKEVLVNTITSDQIHEVLKLLEVDEQTKVDFKLFAGMAAYAERVLYPKCVSEEYLAKLIELQLIEELLGTEDTVDMPEYQKEKIECADFSALDWKFHGVKVNPQIKTLLKQIS